ncbi:hypothetical protein [Roseiflexus sp.]|uniref:hypothetical protein n=1 Tax=Roseiflexus sp. TaxID=2562120 RepID=UPI00398A793E
MLSVDADAKQISRLLHAAAWSADDINAILWQQADAQVHRLTSAGEPAVLVWDGSVWKKPESQANPE